MDTRVRLTESGKKKAQQYINELIAKRKEILDAKLDTADCTEIPTISDIEADMSWDCNIMKNPLEYSEYMNCWGVTDEYNSDYPLVLTKEDFKIYPKLEDFFKWDWLDTEDPDKEWNILVEGVGELETYLSLSPDIPDDECRRVEINGQHYYFGEVPNAKLN